MIREEFLTVAAESNLIMIRNLRDAAVLAGSGFRAGDIGCAYAYERIRIYLELLLKDMSAAAAGLVRPRTAVVSAYTAEAETKTAAVTGLAIASELTAAENRALARTAPPVGRLPGVYEATKTSAERGARLASSLGDILNALYDGSACGKRLHALPLSAVEALSAITDEARAAFEAVSGDTAPTVVRSEAVLDKLAAGLADAFDPVYEAELRQGLARRAEGCFADAAAAAVRGAKCTQPPLFADLIFRYSEI